MKPLLGVRMACVGCIVTGWIEFQDESLRTNCDIGSECGKFYVTSSDFPAMKPGPPNVISLWIRGNRRHKDDKPFGYTFETKKKAKEAVIELTKLIKQINMDAPANESAVCPVPLIF